MTSRAKRFFVGLTAVILAATFFSIYYAQRPAYNWDMIAYMAVALIDSGVPEAEVHQKTYAALSDVPEAARKPLIEDGAYRVNVAKDPAKFLSELPFYSVKPLYPALMSVLYRAGVGLATASIVVSAAAYAGLCILFFVWFSRWAAVAVTAPLVVCIALTPFLTQIARVSTPDMLSTFLVLLGTYVVFEKERSGWGAAILILAITARPDCIIYLWWIFCYLLLIRRVSLLGFAAACAAAGLFYLGQTWFSGNYGWKILMYYTFVDYNMDFRNFTPLALKDYLLIYIRGIDRLIFFSTEYFAIFAVMAWATLCLKFRGRIGQDQYLHLVGIAAACAVTRVMVLPYDYARALLPCYLMILIGFVQACCSTYRRALSPVAP